MAVERITPKKIQSIKNKSAYGLPDSPKDAGYKADRVKKAMYEPTLDLADEVNRIVDQVNGETLQGGRADYYLAEGDALKRERPTGSGYFLEMSLSSDYTAKRFECTLAEGTIVSAGNSYHAVLYFEGLDTTSSYQIRADFQVGAKTVFSKELESFRPVAETDAVEFYEESVLPEDLIATGATKAALVVQARVTEGNDRKVALRVGAAGKASRVSRNEKVTYLPASNVTTKAAGIKQTQESFNREMRRYTVPGSAVEHISHQVVTGTVTGKKHYSSCHFVNAEIAQDAEVVIDGDSTGSVRILGGGG